tara:strand:- start:408 stop:947 length:540 start_codon:yes stop_codon:yes gene_type:complete
VAIAIEVGHYSISKSIKSVLRARLDATLATLGATVTDYLPEDLQGAGSNVYLSDSRIPPQARQYLLISVVHTADERVISLGTQNSTYEIRILSAIRGTQTARSGSDPAPTFEDATWQTAGLLARAADYILERYLVAEASIYNVQRLRQARAPLDSLRPSVCGYVTNYQAFVRTRNPLGE